MRMNVRDWNSMLAPRAAKHHSHRGYFSVLFTVHDLQGILDADYAYRYEPYDLQSSRLQICV